MNSLSRFSTWLAAAVALLIWLVPAASVRAAEAHATNHAAAAAAPAHGAGAGDHGAAPAHDAGTPAAGGHGAHGAHAAAGPNWLQWFGYSYLTAYMFCLSLCVGCFFLTLAHHLFDAGWSTPVRRVTETIASLLFPDMLVLLIPILLLQRELYPWLTLDPKEDHALAVKALLFNPVGFNLLLVLIFASWGLVTHSLRNWSIAQDKDGAAHWTVKSRKLAAGGIFWFAFSVTLVCFFLMKSLQHQFFSTMYGVYYFAGSVWTTLATIYGLTIYLSRPGGPLEKVIFKRQIHDLGVLFFAFTVFYAYIHFSQYFLIWNAAMPEETFWYVRREAGTWKWVGFTILFGHFFVPFLTILNQDIKRNWSIMRWVIVWAWLMHYVDMTFNVMPIPYPNGLHLSVIDLVCLPALVAVLWWRFRTQYGKHAPYPLRDPRLKEAVTHHEIPAPGQAVAHH